MPMFNVDQSCICVFVYLYLGNEGVVVGECIVDVISFQKIFGLYGLKCHIVEIWRDVTFEDGRTDNGRRKCEYRARIREAGFAISLKIMKNRIKHKKKYHWAYWVTLKDTPVEFEWIRSPGFGLDHCCAV